MVKETELSGEVVVASRGFTQTFAGYMIGRAETDAENRGEAAFDQQLAAMMNAETEDEAWAADETGTTQARDLVGCEIQIFNMTSHASTREDIEGLGFFITCNAVMLAGPKNVLTATGLKVGDEFVLSTGAPLVVGKIRWHEAHEKLPFAAQIIQAGRALKLARPVERAVQG